MNLGEAWQNKQLRILFCSLIVLLLGLLYAFRYAIAPSYDDSLSTGFLPALAKISEDFATTILGTGVVALIFSLIKAPQISKSGAIIVEPRELDREFSKALGESNTWSFYGGCGRYFRSGVINSMKKRVARDSSRKTLTAIVLDPSNTTLCQQHADYRSGTRRGKTEKIWTADRVRNELLVTIIIAMGTSIKEPALGIQIFVTNQFSSFRADISDLSAIETREDPYAPALKSEYGTYFYNALRDEFAILQKQSRQITTGAVECSLVSNVANLRVAIDALGMSGLNLRDHDYDQILDIFKKNKNPYA